ncbi:hypothetical protein WMY93_028333 [Mugilogobius chulae]|uniref:C-type lectin domain-containing protein n=1 Tax=Mugilogobius chulae TaxID=88201 RepID=A0AAW0MZ10_9GOBI
MGTKAPWENWVRNNETKWFKGAVKCLATVTGQTGLVNVTKAQQLINWYTRYKPQNDSLGNMSYANCLKDKNQRCRFELPFRDITWDEAMYNCSKHLPNDLAAIRNQSASDPQVFFEAWSWAQLAGLTSGLEMAIAAFDTDTLRTLVVPYVVMTNRSTGQEKVIHHVLLSYPEHPKHDQGYHNGKATEEKMDLYPNSIYEEKLNRSANKRYTRIKDTRQGARYLEHKIADDWFHWPWLKRVMYGLDNQGHAPTQIHNYARFMRRIEKEHPDRRKQPNAVVIAAWLSEHTEILGNVREEKSQTYKNNPNYLYQRQLFLSPHILHTVKKYEGEPNHEDKPAQWSQKGFLQSAFPIGHTSVWANARYVPTRVTRYTSTWNGVAASFDQWYTHDQYPQLEITPWINPNETWRSRKPYWCPWGDTTSKSCALAQINTTMEIGTLAYYLSSSRMAAGSGSREHRIS